MMKKQISKLIAQLSFKDPSIKGSQPRYLLMSLQARTPAHNRNVNQVFINYDQKKACNDAASVQ
jgi:hypothetical protein